jgi:flavin-dependent dehydrogenase
VRSDHPQDLVSLHNFPGGYCGVCSIEDGLTNLCYLTHRDNLKSSGNIQEMENDVLFRNPLLKQLFANCSFVFEKPEVINEVSFETKGPVENHILMAGDAAGMITPLCGNGMAIAMRSGKIVSSLVRDFVHGKIDRATLEHLYCREWNNAFRQRLWFGRKLQRLFGSTHFSELAVTLTRSSRTIGDLIVRNTHGKYF